MDWNIFGSQDTHWDKLAASNREDRRSGSSGERTEDNAGAEDNLGDKGGHPVRFVWGA